MLNKILNKKQHDFNFFKVVPAKQSVFYDPHSKVRISHILGIMLILGGLMAIFPSKAEFISNFFYGVGVLVGVLTVKELAVFREDYNPKVLPLFIKCFLCSVALIVPTFTIFYLAFKIA